MGYWEAVGQTDEWYTPKHVFDALGVVFDLDVAAPSDHQTFVPAKAFISANSLEKEWRGFIWMNPPFGGRNGLKPWLEKFFSHGDGIALVPDRTSAPWFQKAWASSDLALFTPKLRFHRPDGSVGKSPSNGTTLLGSGKRAVSALMTAAHAGLGVLGKPLKPRIKHSDDDIMVANFRLREMFASIGGGFAEMKNTETMALTRFLSDRISNPHELHVVRPAICTFCPEI